MTAANDPDSTRALDLQARAWVRRLRSGAATERDAQRLRDWCTQSPAHRAAFARAKQEWQALGPAAVAHRQRFGAAEPVGRVGATPDPRRRWFLGAGLSAAASAAAVALVHPPLGLWPSWSELQADYRTGIGQQRTVALGDDVALVLNTQTSLAVQSGEGVARVRLVAGEAALQRGPGARPVELLAGEARVRPAAGAGVEVRQQDARYCVTCTEGRAELVHPARTLALREGERLWFGADGVAAAAQVDVAQAQAWRRGVVVFQATPLADAVAEINRYRAGRVMLLGEALAKRRLSGHFRIAALDEAIAQIETLYGARVTRLPGAVVLLR